ncbi:MAG: hypothetical protein EBQ66_00235 [Flavobacteriia bacterium]|nr:hypothetical protein [Flavobacteriia bacterium]
MGWKGVYAYHTELNASIPNAGIAWGSYLGTLNNGEYHYTAVDCGPGSLISNVPSFSLGAMVLHPGLWFQT